jgi:hypothetical protein
MHCIRCRNRTQYQADRAHMLFTGRVTHTDCRHEPLAVAWHICCDTQERNRMSS